MRHGPGTGSRTIARPLALLAATLATLVGVAEAVIATGPLSSLYVPYLFPALGAVYAATGLLAWWRRPANGLGSLMVVCGAVITLSSLGNTDDPALIAVGAIVATVPLSVVIHLVHASPTGQVLGAAAKATVAAGYLAGLVLQAPIWAFTPEPPPFDVVLISPHVHWADVGADVQKSFGAAVVLVSIVLVGRRIREYSTAERRLLAALLLTSVVALAAAAVGADVLPPLFDLGVEGVVDVQIAALALVPVGFLVVVLRGAFAPPARFGEFAESVAMAVGSPEPHRDLDSSVADALGDPTAVVLRRSGTASLHRDGYEIAEPQSTALRAVVPVDGPAGPLGVLMHDTGIGADATAIAAVARVVGIAIEREHLAAEVTASRAALLQASQRVLAIGDAERRRIARDLHDGLQGSLVLLSLQARQLGRDLDGGDAEAAFGLADSVDTAARRLRDLVRGVVPAALLEGGLASAIGALAEELPIPTDVLVEGPVPALPTIVETTAYFVVTEAVTNAIKHAGASRLSIAARVGGGSTGSAASVVEGSVLTVEVIDDGHGGVDEGAGTGLRGLHDRLAVVGGTLEVTSDATGTRVRARLPGG